MLQREQPEDCVIATDLQEIDSLTSSSAERMLLVNDRIRFYYNLIKVHVPPRRNRH